MMRMQRWIVVQECGRRSSALSEYSGMWCGLLPAKRIVTTEVNIEIVSLMGNGDSLLISGVNSER